MADPTGGLLGRGGGGARRLGVEGVSVLVGGRGVGLVRLVVLDVHVELPPLEGLPRVQPRDYDQ